MRGSKTSPPSMSKDEKKWRSEDDLRTLTSAHEIQHDKPRLRGAHGIARKQMTSLRRITGSKR